MRTYKRKPCSRKYKDYDEETLEKALESYVSGQNTLKEAGEQYGMPYVTIYRKFKGLHSKPHGGQTALTPNEEKAIVKGVSVAAEWGFPFERGETFEMVKSYLDQKGSKIRNFSNNTPGEGWFHGFMKRHGDTIT
ncbi:hypothetical protein PPYR_04797 [Photinus pyralis]|uniref:HTH CENPB-type domain-containing protein n=1 Tax=Photinus pyralis TaxID=7054 RepID=A0A5N3ZYX1_PHOPY|nr:hypothetical protein PPYR_15399 [Photinus pyralis]KAB0802611.1 hypothetical protein PPYR_04797 [Photinus pyralis]